jgi:hypothetical protein
MNLLSDACVGLCYFHRKREDERRKQGLPPSDDAIAKKFRSEIIKFGQNQTLFLSRGFFVVIFGQFLFGNCSQNCIFCPVIVVLSRFYYHQAGLAKPAGISVSCAAATASHLSQSYRRERTQISTRFRLRRRLRKKHEFIERTV